MAFQLTCPNCGLRPVWEFRYGGPALNKPSGEAGPRQWAAFLYDRPNPAGEQLEWWYHRSACQIWFQIRRDTRTNHMLVTSGHGPESGRG